MIQVEYITLPESCYGYADGMFRIETLSGGIGEIKGFIEGNEIKTDQTLTDLVPRKYILKLIDSLKCEKKISFTIKAANSHWCRIGEDKIINPGDKLDILLNHNFDSFSTILWFGNGKLLFENKENISFTPDQNMEMIVQISDNLGCEASDTMLIRIKNEIFINIPNIFSPDGDGLNDTWDISRLNHVKSIKSVDIYDRWGENIHHIENLTLNTAYVSLWDGKFKNTKVIPGVYVYMIKIISDTGEEEIKYGDVNVLY